ncbi:hypothetical protein DMB92_00245 [Campylobacter sp. MIT 99-7217]|uniref:Cj0814 family flagellar-dependent secreted protein n=1 Tax=Campylobacter sp. MIT 99-7217 TaxID=535091 RepID=UPI0011575932|nr:hypothetical protein [Campylobacter sp. MIT 99-7217]TQR34433.1 hypothetical protein DMB92_00245 [Campylobacter sp. MIT 99-7217]
MLNSLNSNYTYTNSQNMSSKGNLKQERNLNLQNLNDKNILTSINENLTNLNLVTDKHEAVDQILGYGVDKEGFFTSDFNEVAGLPKDFKIYAKDAQSFIKWQESSDFFFSTHAKVDFAKTLANAYKLFSKIMPDTPNASYSKEELENLSYGFSVDENLNVKQIYHSRKDFLDHLGKTNERNYTSFHTWNGSFFDKLETKTLFSQAGGSFVSMNAYINTDESVDKGGVLMAFANTHTFGAGAYFLEGETNIFGKILTLDKNISKKELKDFANFMNTNKLQSAFLDNPFQDDSWNIFEDKLSMKLYIIKSQELGNSDIAKKAEEFENEYSTLINSNLSLEDFKEKYLDFKQRHDEFVKEFELAMNEALKNSNKQITSENTNKNISESKLDTNNKTQKTPTPIQAKSSNQTYKDKPTNEFLQKLLKDKFEESDLLELLFEDKTYKQSFKNIFKNENLNLALQFLQVDIKA